MPRLSEMTDEQLIKQVEDDALAREIFNRLVLARHRVSEQVQALEDQRFKYQSERDVALGQLGRLEHQINRYEKEIESLREETQDLSHNYHLLASEMVYGGNSVQHWKNKASAYKGCARAISKCKQILEVESPDEVAAAVEQLRKQGNVLSLLAGAGDQLCFELESWLATENDKESVRAIEGWKRLRRQADTAGGNW